MLSVEGKATNEVCAGNQSLDPKRWLEEEVNKLALRFPGLFELPIATILPLAQLSAIGPMTVTDLVRITELKKSVVEDCLDALCDYKLARECSVGFEATDKGKDVFLAIGTQLIIRKKLEMNCRNEHLDSLYEQLIVAWYKL